MDADGEVVFHTIYDPWGNPVTDTGTDLNFSGLDNRNNYTGYSWDETLDLYFAQARFYDPAAHRFTQEDPVKDGVNWYGYAESSPLNYIDPLGQQSVVVWGAAHFGWDLVVSALGELFPVLKTVTLFPNSSISDIQNNYGYTYEQAEAIYNSREELKSILDALGGSASREKMVNATNTYVRANKDICKRVFETPYDKNETSKADKTSSVSNTKTKDVATHKIPAGYVEQLGCEVDSEPKLQQQALAARDAALADIATWSSDDRQDVTTVAAGINKKTGLVAVGINKTSVNHGLICAEDLVVAQLGGIGNINDIIMTPAIRPRTGQIIAVCQRCQTKYPRSSFLPGTPFA